MDLQVVGCGYVDCIGLAQDRDRWRTLVSAVMNLRIPWNAGNFLTSCKPVSCSWRTLHHGVSKYLLGSRHSVSVFTVACSIRLPVLSSSVRSAFVSTFPYIQCTLPLYYRQHVSYVLQCSNFYSISSKKFCETESCFMVSWDGFCCKESCAGVSSFLIHRSGDEHCSDWLASFRICMLRVGLQEEAWWCGSINSPFTSDWLCFLL